MDANDLTAEDIERAVRHFQSSVAVLQAVGLVSSVTRRKIVTPVFSINLSTKQWTYDNGRLTVDVKRFVRNWDK